MTETSRRGFLAGMLAIGAAPVIVRASSLMPLYVPPKLILWGDGVHDDTEAAQALLDGRRIVRTPAGVLLPAGRLEGHRLKISGPLMVRTENYIGGCSLVMGNGADYGLYFPRDTERSVVRDMTIVSCSNWSGGIGWEAGALSTIVMAHPKKRQSLGPAA